VIRADNGKEFCDRAMLTWAHSHQVKLTLIEQGKPPDCLHQSFNGRLRDGCLNEHWSLNLTHVRVIIEAWRREYNEERPKIALGGLTPAVYARQLARKSATVATGL
jgi:transposase InsO family protein